MMESKTDLQRLQQEYSRRAGESKTKDRYSSENPAHQWMISDRQRKIRDLLKKGRIHGFQTLNILEIGCGSGGVINVFLRSGAVPSALQIKVLFDRRRNCGLFRIAHGSMQWSDLLLKTDPLIWRFNCNFLICSGSKSSVIWLRLC